jgi:large subunit ribosomal protein L22
MAQIETKKTPVAKVKVAAPQKSAKTVAPAVKKLPKVSQVTPPVVDAPKLSKFINKNLKVSPRKLRLLVANIKKLDPVTAVGRLKFTNTNAARLLCKCLEDAIASAKHNYNFMPQTLKFTDFRVDEGMKIKRMDKSHGSRFARGVIQKRHSRLIIVLSGTIAG